MHAVAGMNAVIHNAAIIPPMTDRNLTLSEKVNIGGTQNIITAIQQSPLKPLLVFPSSISVHGFHLPGSPFPKKITDPLHGEDNYASHKITCEQLIKESGIDAVVVRIGACMEGRNEVNTTDAKDMMKMMFDVAPMVRIEYVHPKDVATAMANAINNPAALGKTFFLGGGKSCQCYWSEFNSFFLDSMGCKPFPNNAFGTQGYYTDWMDTEESQRVLKFQHHTLEDYKSELAKKMKWIKPVTTLFSSFILRYLLSHSEHYKK